jgi:3-deoxy-D-manno-octulosonate 8-phosphate phosphatase (KDO 8-P phosphatase)
MTIQEKFTHLGGIFLSSQDVISEKLQSTKGIIFDWDGVFNNGIKGSESASGFSEADSMGLNMFRFNQWRLTGKIPITCIITGENNSSAVEFAKREHLHAVYSRFANKITALNHLSKTYTISFRELAFVMDDILDLSASSQCNLSFCIRRNASPLFQEFVSTVMPCDYITANEGGKHAIRELCEMLIGIGGQYKETIQSRIFYDEAYKQYITERNLINTEIETSR